MTTVAGGQMLLLGNISGCTRDTASVKKPLAEGKGISVIALGIKLPVCGHACLLVLDATTAKMPFFDPQGSRYQWLNIAFAKRNTLV